MDGLVLDTEKLFTRFWMEASAHHGFPMTREQALGMRSLGREDGIRKIHDYFGPAGDYVAIRQTRIQRMSAYLAEHGPEPKPGIYALLDHLDRLGIPAAITSASPVERIEEYLCPLNLCHRFRKVCSAHQVERGKPAPDIYLHGAAQLGLDPRECLALEDSPTGILSAHRAGCLPVLIPDQDDPSGQIAHLLYAKADSLSDVMDLVGEHP